MNAMPAAPGLRVLVVDDRRDITVILRTLLTRVGYEVETADEGDTALDLARRFKPDAVISDLALPGATSGFELVRIIRSEAGQRSPRCIAITGHDDPDHRQLAKDAGFHDYLVKPADLQQLLKILADVTSAAKE